MFCKRNWRWAYGAYTSRVFPESWIIDSTRTLPRVSSRTCTNPGLMNHDQGPGGVFLPLIDLMNHAEPRHQQLRYVGRDLDHRMSPALVTWTSPVRPGRKRNTPKREDGMRNIKNKAKVELNVEEDEKSGLGLFCLRATNVLPKSGEQFFNNYGERDTAEWLSKYGFIPTSAVNVSTKMCSVPNTDSNCCNLSDSIRISLHQYTTMPKLTPLMRDKKNYSMGIAKATRESSVSKMLDFLRQSVVANPVVISWKLCNFPTQIVACLLRHARICVANESDCQREFNALPEKVSIARMFCTPLHCRASFKMSNSCSYSNKHQPNNSTKAQTNDDHIDVRAVCLLRMAFKHLLSLYMSRNNEPVCNQTSDKSADFSCTHMSNKATSNRNHVPSTASKLVQIWKDSQLRLLHMVVSIIDHTAQFSAKGDQ